MAYLRLFTLLAGNSQRNRWLLYPGSRKFKLFSEITSDFTGYFFVVTHFWPNSR